MFILADDLGIKDLSVEGSTYYETPHIDALARSAMRFTNGYSTCQVCSPSRASIMTGTYPARHGITDWIGAASGLKWKRNNKVLPAEYVHQLDPDDTTLAEAFAAHGYQTFFAGKWHLGKGEESLPTKHGFQINKGGYHSGSPRGGYFSPYNNPELEDGPTGESLPLRLARETTDFIAESQKSEAPFFAYLSFYSVHGPIQTSRELWTKYQQKAAQNPHAGPRFLIDRTLPVRQVQDCPIYAGMMEAMDDAVGQVLAKLDELGIADNTIIVFTSDNGGVSSGDAFATSCLPLRGGKGRQWEGGIKQPYYIKAPGTSSPGSSNATPVTGTDFFPTLLELAGLPLLPEQHRDGLSLVPLLKGGKIAERALFWHYPHYGNQGGEPSAIIREGDWKLIHYYEDGRDELYQLASDPSEQNDLAAQEKATAAQLRAKLDQWLSETGARLPQPDERFDAEKRAKQDERIKSQQLPKLEAQHARFLDPDFQPNKTWWDSTVD
ncbi:MAG: sulfatase [Verrucomicrobiales bacterium]